MIADLRFKSMFIPGFIVGTKFQMQKLIVKIWFGPRSRNVVWKPVRERSFCRGGGWRYFIELALEVPWQNEPSHNPPQHSLQPRSEHSQSAGSLTTPEFGRIKILNQLVWVWIVPVFCIIILFGIFSIGVMTFFLSTGGAIVSHGFLSLM